MKILNKKLPYSIKRVIPMAMLAGATLFLNPSCKRDEPDDPTKNQGGNNKTEQPVMRDVELYFDCNIDWDGNDPKPFAALHMDTINKYVAMTDVANIYLIPTKKRTWLYYQARNITDFRQKLQPRLDASPKVHGRGDFDFELGEASKVPEDSLWYVQNGWTINKQYSR